MIDSSSQHPGARTAASVEFRPARPEDEPEILALFERVFGGSRSSERWNWQYRDSPGGPGIVTVAEADGKVVGCVTLMRQDLNYAGERIPAAQGCDAMLEESHRGEGRFPRLGQENYKSGAAAGLNAMFAFPNQNSFAPSVRGLGHDLVAVFSHYYRRLGFRRSLSPNGSRVVSSLFGLPNRAALAVLRARLRSPLHAVSTQAVPDDIGALLKAYGRRHVLSFWKDREYLRWRYEEHPEHDYRFHTLRNREGKPLALAVVRRVHDTVAICELLHPEQRIRETAYLLRELVRWAGRDPSCQIVEFYGSDAGFFEAAFMEAGFHGRPHSSLRMTGRALREHPIARRLPLGSNWTLTHGDTDVI